MNKNYMVQHYINHYGAEEEILLSYCPYRICPLGAHVDHQLGLVTGFALNYGVHISYAINDDGLCQVISHNFRQRKRFNVKDILERKNDWADYIRGTIKALVNNGYTLKNGINAYIYGELPIGGLSSSAAVIIAFLNAITNANGIKLTNQELIDFAYIAETSFMGMSIGKLDQSCEVLSKKDKLLVLDTKTGEYNTIPIGINHHPFKFLIIHSGVERFLAGSAYNVRVDECKASAFLLKALSNMEYGKYKDTYLRDVPEDIFNQYKHYLPENFKKRCVHFYNENDRVLRGQVAWGNGDIVEFGKIVSESGKSSIELYEVGSPHLKDLYNIIVSTNNVYGTRFMGGGFNGACLAIINPEYEEEIIENIRNKYIELHPEVVDKVSFHICKSEDGVGE